MQCLSEVVQLNSSEKLSCVIMSAVDVQNPVDWWDLFIMDYTKRKSQIKVALKNFLSTKLQELNTTKQFLGERTSQQSNGKNQLQSNVKNYLC